LKTGIKEQKQALHEEYQVGLEAILSEDQLAALAELKANHMGRRGCNKDSDMAAPEDEVTTEATLQLAPFTDGVATAVEKTSWGRIKDAFGN
jgi:hypothetical protein